MTLEMSPSGVADAPTSLSAFEDDLLALNPQLKVFARRLCGDRDKADDLAQAALARAWQHRATYSSGTNLRAWLFTIARNLFLSGRRRDWREVAWDDDAWDLMPDGSVDPGVRLELSDTLGAMRQLATSTRQALLLIGLAGVSYEPAALVCGCSVGTVKSRVGRGRRELAAVLDGRRGGRSKPRIDARRAAKSLMAELQALAAPDAPRSQAFTQPGPQLPVGRASARSDVGLAVA